MSWFIGFHSKIMEQQTQAISNGASVAPKKETITPDKKISAGGLGNTIPKITPEKANPIIPDQVKPLPLPPHSSQARKNLVSLLEQKEMVVLSKEGKKVFVPNRKLEYLAALKRNIDVYEQDLKAEDSFWCSVCHATARLFSVSVTQQADDYYNCIKSTLSPKDRKLLETIEKYGGPFVGEYQANRDPKPNEPMQGFPGIDLQCPEGLYSGPVEDNMPDGTMGRMIFKDGAIYTGPFKNGMPMAIMVL